MAWVWKFKTSWEISGEWKPSCITPGVGGFSEGLPEDGTWRDSGAGKEGTWRDKGSPKISWEKSSLSKAKKSRSCGRSSPCILRTDIDKELLEILTVNNPAATASIKGSPKSVKLDSEAIPVCPRVV